MNKSVLISGATRGLGLAIAKRLLADGYQVIGIGRSDTEATRELLQVYQNRFHFYQVDLLHTADIKNFVRLVVKNHGRLYGLVNNAALGHDGVLATMHESEISQLIKVNIEAPILLSKYASRSMLINRNGRIINISSIIASTGFNGLSVYGATKAAMVGLTKSLSRELGKGGITVNNVAPGYMATDMTVGLQGGKLESIIRRSPMRKLAETSDVADAVAYLLSSGAKMITGTTITVDAGSTA